MEDERSTVILNLPSLETAIPLLCHTMTLSSPALSTCTSLLTPLMVWGGLYSVLAIPAQLQQEHPEAEGGPGAEMNSSPSPTSNTAQVPWPSVSQSKPPALSSSFSLLNTHARTRYLKVVGLQKESCFRSFLFWTVGLLELITRTKPLVCI